MGGRGNPLRDAAAIVGIGQTEFAKQTDRPDGQLAVVALVAARLATSGEGVPTSAVVVRAV